MSVVISVRIPKRVKEVPDRHGVNISELLERVLVEEARRLEEVVERLRGELDPLKRAGLIKEGRRLG